MQLPFAVSAQQIHEIVVCTYCWCKKKSSMHLLKQKFEPYVVPCWRRQCAMLMKSNGVHLHRNYKTNRTTEKMIQIVLFPIKLYTEYKKRPEKEMGQNHMSSAALCNWRKRSLGRSTLRSLLFRSFTDGNRKRPQRNDAKQHYLPRQLQ